jgi:hypothetical protein
MEKDAPTARRKGYPSMNVKEDAKIVRPFLEAVKNVIGTMAMIEVVSGKPFMKRDTWPAAT